jgi:hypothetical protein
MEERNLLTLFNLVGVGKLLPFTVSLLNSLQKYQFDWKLTSKKWQIFKFIVAAGRWLHFSPIATFGLWQGSPITITMGLGHITKTVATKYHSNNGRVSPSDHCYCDRACLLAIEHRIASRKFSPTSLSDMKTVDVKTSYYPKLTRVDSGRKDYTNSIQIDWSWYNLILYSRCL